MLPGDGAGLVVLVVGGWATLAAVGSAAGWALRRAGPARLRRLAAGAPLGVVACLFPLALRPSWPWTGASDWLSALAGFGVVATVAVAVAAAATRWPRGVAFGVLGLVVVDLVPVRWPSAHSTPGEGDDLVVLVTLDTFRADHVSAIGGFRADVQTPHLDELARTGVLFEQGVAPVPLTLPSHAGMLSGAFPPRIGVVANGDGVGSGAPLVAAELAAAGWRTGAFVGSSVLDARWGLARGFDHYDDRFHAWHRVAHRMPWRALGALDLPLPRTGQRRGEVVVERALRWLGAQSGPRFLWVHLYDAHSPYRPAPDHPVDAEASGAPGSIEWVTGWRHWRRESSPRRAGPARPPPVLTMTPRDLRAPLAAYASEVMEVDALVGRLLDALPPDAAVVVAADHGEHLGEHGYALNHGRHLFEPSVRVPLWVRAPGVEAGTRVRQPVSAVRVGDTIRALAGLPRASDGLLEPIVPGDRVEMVAPAQESRFDLGLGPNAFEYAWREGSRKWTVDGFGAHWTVDLASDPAERALVPIDDEAVVETARERLDAWRGVEARRRSERSAEERAMLEALGYVE